MLCHSVVVRVGLLYTSRGVSIHVSCLHSAQLVHNDGSKIMIISFQFDDVQNSCCIVFKMLTSQFVALIIGGNISVCLD